MTESPRHRPRPPAARWRRSTATAACLLAVGSLSSCSPTRAGDQGPEAADPTGPSESADREEGRPAPRLPAVPSSDDPRALARQLDRVVAVLESPAASAPEVRRAGQLQQLAIRVLAAARPGFRQAALRRARAHTASVVRGDVAAARELQSLTGPQPELPRWRVVAPPPARELLGHYRRAQRRTGVPWRYLAAIHLVETRMGRIRGTSTAGARGPMQFIPSTWAIHGGGGDIEDPRHAILAAGRLLRAHGAPNDMARALWHYNPSEHYVRAVSAHARTMRQWRPAYRGYYHWRVLYRHERGTYVLPLGYPGTRPWLVPGLR